MPIKLHQLLFIKMTDTPIPNSRFILSELRSLTVSYLSNFCGSLKFYLEFSNVCAFSCKFFFSRALPCLHFGSFFYSCIHVHLWSFAFVRKFCGKHVNHSTVSAEM